jgi:hypothetical protein
MRRWRSSQIAIAFVLLSTDHAMSATAKFNCVPPAHLQQATQMFEQADAEMNAHRYEDAAYHFKAALGVLDYRLGIITAIDDSGEALGLADWEERGGNFETAATIRRTTLRERLGFSKPLGSSECRPQH